MTAGNIVCYSGGVCNLVCSFTDTVLANILRLYCDVVLENVKN